ncbi:MAG: hypothetical protein IT424_15560 [Pirellulales bacterium]|nr:hypothetical protein [Pirellulales bacterium]
MSASTLPFEIPQPVAAKVSRLRLLVRLYSISEGCCAVAIVAGCAYWLGLGVDWLLEPPPGVRAVLIGLVAAAACYVAWRYIGRRLVARLPADSLALLVERQYPELKEGLVTTVQAGARYDEGLTAGSSFAAKSQAATPGSWTGSARHASATASEIYGERFGRTLIDSTSRRAAEAMTGVHLRRVFDLRPLARKAALALALLIAIVAFALLKQDAFAFYWNRIQLGAEPWPRRVHLTVVGFAAGSGSPPVNVARGDDYELEVLASIVDGYQAPEEVEIRWRRPSDGGRGSGPMLRIGSASPGRDAAQQFRYTFKVSSDLEFDVIGGDDRIYDLRLRAVERPAITRVWMEVVYPKYMNRGPRSAPVSGRAELTEGASALCRLETNKPLRSVQVHDLTEQVDVPAAIAATSATQFSFAIGPAASDRVFAITLHDADGVENREPFRLPLAVIMDQPPEAAVGLRGIGSAVTPQATIPFSGRLRDDHGLQEGWFEYRIDGGDAARRSLRTQPEGLVELRMTERFDLSEVDPQTNRPSVAVQPGQKLSLEVQARDAYDLAAQPHVGGSQRFMLEVVTPSDLRAILEKRELGLRHRFEAIYEKMVGVGDLLDRIDLAPPPDPADDTEGAAQAGAAPQAAGEPDRSLASRSLDRDRSRISGVRQTALQLASETAGVADGFDDIVAELVNNRVDTEELRQRLEVGIAEPLKQISGERLPQFEQRMAALQQAFAEAPAEAAEPLAAAKSDAAETADAMKAVLDRMLELESYNELVELLRGIVADQQQIKEQTQRQQREKLRGLLDE